MGGERLVLPPRERRVLGVLLEKELATPAYYPLTVNAATSSCNQKSNRDPVTEYTEAEVEDALEQLRARGLASAVFPAGGRVAKWRHLVREALGLEAAARAVLAELLLRGPQTPGELRARASRMRPLADLPALQQAIEQLAGHDPPLVTQLGTAGSRRAVRYAHTLYPEEELAALGGGAGRAGRRGRRRRGGSAAGCGGGVATGSVAGAGAPGGAAGGTPGARRAAGGMNGPAEGLTVRESAAARSGRSEGEWDAGVA
ncbi:MAG: hypothetical protein KatS3mg102_2813 [Planctomycetota bacterium]|nr:MAG: hypothetical protein KatS3mg102_2813 [Planctomycetota bacterium]